MIVCPRINIDLKKFRDNAANIKKLLNNKGVDVYPVIKGAGADRKLLEILSDLKFDTIADSRIHNLLKFQDLPVKKMLLRLPMISSADEVVAYSDISLNSEIETIKALNKAAEKQQKKHEIILMIELGDLREGILPKDVEQTVEQILSLKNIVLKGVGVNLTCYGAIIPNTNNIGELCSIAKHIREKFNIPLEIVSGGNSSSIPMFFDGSLPKEVNVLRLGEAILLGTESVTGTVITGQHEDVFTLEAELIELKDKDSVPTGRTGYDAFGKPFKMPENKGTRRRGIVAIGRQDVELDTLYPIDKKITIIGGSSDHVILDMEDVKDSYKIGDTVQFNIHYSSLMRMMTSSYIPKNYIN